MKITSTDDINYGDLPDYLGFHIRRTYTAYLRIFTSIVGKRYALKSQQYSILVLTANNAGITPSAIADAIEVKRSLIAVLTEDLRQRGLLKVATSNEDRRQKELFLTAKGQIFTKQVQQTVHSDLPEKVEIQNVFNINMKAQDNGIGNSTMELSEKIADILREQAIQHGIDIT